MANEEITVGTVSDGPDEGDTVSLPVVDLLTGRGFVTGKSGSGKSNSASVIAEKLLDRGYALLVVDIDGEYYGLKEKYEVLHVGADEECDIQVSPEHAEKIASLALENNIPIILDVSSYLDEDEAAELLTAVARQLFAKEKKLKKPFLLIVEEVHEYIPEGGGLGECGRMLIKIGKRGRKHGLGITGISQRPADVKKDFITQCDWLCWHRLTWKNDTQVVRRVLSGEYAEAVESLDDGEAFVRSDWSEKIRPVQFDRKQTFDAGATPGLDDFERPDLKPVSTDLVSELEQISENKRQREAEIERLERKLADKEARIEKLERDLADARDLSRMADQFASALFDRSGRSRVQLESEQQTLDAYPMTLRDVRGRSIGKGTPRNGNGYLNRDEIEILPSLSESEPEAAPNSKPQSETESDPESEAASDSNPESEAASESEIDANPDAENESVDETSDTTNSDGCDGDLDPETDGVCDDEKDRRADEEDDERLVVQRIRRSIADLDPVAREMLARYRSDGPISPVDAHVAAGGSGERMMSYWRNSALRRADLITHVGRGQYAYALPERIAADHDGRLPPEEVENCVARIENELLPDVDG
ncbi:ATP-binding protein [Halocatena marina]|uniref:ATP-binding protein n=1 Tax=Halocatena marina TaxID=2934937 RepID=UPI00200D1438|nr:DUF87 domain-containing protein [Halocatena marina]